MDIRTNIKDSPKTLLENTEETPELSCIFLTSTYPDLILLSPETDEAAAGASPVSSSAADISVKQNLSQLKRTK